MAILWFGQQDHSLHMFQWLTDGVDIEVGHLKALDVGLGGSWVSKPRSLLGCFLSPTHIHEGAGLGIPHLCHLSSFSTLKPPGPALPGLVMGRASLQHQSQLSCIHFTRVRSAIFSFKVIYRVFFSSIAFKSYQKSV